MKTADCMCHSGLAAAGQDGSTCILLQAWTWLMVQPIMNNLRLDWQKCGNCWGQTQGQSLNFPFLWGHLCGCCVCTARCIFKLNALACKGKTMHKTYPGMLLPSLVEFRYMEGVRSSKASSPRLMGEGLSGLFLGLQYTFCADTINPEEANVFRVNACFQGSSLSTMFI